MGTEQVPLWEQNEQVVREYFEARSGWRVTNLPSGADFRICYNNDCFLCEIKTIKSVRANFPYTSEYYFVDERKKRQKEIEKWKEENPDKQLILHQEEWQFIYGDEVEFRRKHRDRKRYTEVWFRKFAKTMEERLAKSSIGHLPYTLGLHSDDLYVPSEQKQKPQQKSEQDTFFKWLENEILAIHREEPSRHWDVQNLGASRIYSANYSFHERKPNRVSNPSSKYQLMAVGPRKAGRLEINFHCYGQLNIDAIDRNIRGKGKALQQLEGSALLVEEDQQIPRIVVLAFESRVENHLQQLSEYITELLRETPSLSAVAVLLWTPDGTPPREEYDFPAWLRFHLTTPKVPSFIVYHNSWLKGVKPLPANIFSDKWSVQIYCETVSPTEDAESQ